ncbi:hypothetical protein C3Z06_16275 [Cupriavidus metallidurans]|nr:hypothetical protein C3Z06_16275 [Cupriavidus metallidurans]
MLIELIQMHAAQMLHCRSGVTKGSEEDLVSAQSVLGDTRPANVTVEVIASKLWDPISGLGLLLRSARRCSLRFGHELARMTVTPITEDCARQSEYGERGGHLSHPASRTRARPALCISRPAIWRKQGRMAMTVR